MSAFCPYCGTDQEKYVPGEFGELRGLLVVRMKSLKELIDDAKAHRPVRMQNPETIRDLQQQWNIWSSRLLSLDNLFRRNATLEQQLVEAQKVRESENKESEKAIDKLCHEVDGLTAELKATKVVKPKSKVKPLKKRKPGKKAKKKRRIKR